jgi:hypothetical protein
MNYYKNLFVLFFIIYIPTDVNNLFGAQSILTNNKKNPLLTKLKNNKGTICFGALALGGLVAPRLLKQFGQEIPHEKIVRFVFPLALSGLFALSNKNNKLEKKESSLKKYLIPGISLGISGAVLYAASKNPGSFCANNAYELMSIQTAGFWLLNYFFIKKTHTDLSQITTLHTDLSQITTLDRDFSQITTLHEYRKKVQKNLLLTLLLRLKNYESEVKTELKNLKKCQSGLETELKNSKKCQSEVRTELEKILEEKYIRKTNDCTIFSDKIAIQMNINRNIS